jgi:hypothetical protein
MRRSRLQLAVAATLFVGWLSWLVYLAATGTDDVVLSRPQFLVANVHVLAKLDGKDGPNTEAIVEEVLYWNVRDQAKPRPGEKIKIVNLTECADQGWTAPGPYILALMTEKGAYRVAPTPRTPGYPYGRNTPANRPGPPRIYPSTPSRIQQLKAIEKSYSETFN